ncbi:MAG: phosphoribosylformylglycinamidine cyclo-ligase [Myxococcales bacterium]|nr:phosphoribosylformylglycinamidine cyclo-ligase [Myxococcales bacterium]
MVAELQIQDDASAVAYGWAQRTFAARAGKLGTPVASGVGQFSSWLQGVCPQIAMTSDGIGTKIEIAERTGNYTTLGYDLMAMVIDDLAANGAEPLALTNILDVDVVHGPTVDSLMRGLHDAAMASHVAVVGGEIAELGQRIGGFGSGMHFNWCATAVGQFTPGWQPIDGRTVVVGNVVIALASGNWRSNGFSALRRTLAAQFGPDWHTTQFADRSWGDWLLEPCRIYAPLIVALRQQHYELQGLSHITGGGIPSKFGRTLKASGLGAQLTQLPPPTAAMAEVQRLGAVADRDAFQFWNMGSGFLLTVPASTAANVVEFAESLGYAAQIAGEITAEPTIVIETPRSTLRYAVH